MSLRRGLAIPKISGRLGTGGRARESATAFLYVFSNPAISDTAPAVAGYLKSSFIQRERQQAVRLCVRMRENEGQISASRLRQVLVEDYPVFRGIRSWWHATHYNCVRLATRSDKVNHVSEIAQAGDRTFVIISRPLSWG